MNFQSSMEMLNNNLLQKRDQDFMENFLSLHKIAQKSFPIDYFNFLREIGLAKEIKFLQKQSAEMIKETDSYEIDTEKRVIKVKKGKALLEAPLVNISDLIRNKYQLMPNSWQWHLVGSYFYDSENFAMVQTAKAIILEERV